jgi:DNA-binding GntR family transcriptional regulator
MPIPGLVEGARPTRALLAYHAIKRRIITLELAPSSFFTEPLLAAQMQLSKTPIREALGRLQSEGLVEVVGRNGYRASPVTLKDTRDLMGLRILLEGETAALAANQLVDGTLLQTLNELCRVSYNPKDTASITAFLQANTKFHATVAHAGGNARMAEVLERVLDQAERLFHLGLSLTSRAEEIVHEHQDLLKAIMSGDAKLAREIAEAQSRAAQAMILNALLSSESLLTAKIVVGVPITSIAPAASGPSDGPDR